LLMEKFQHRENLHATTAPPPPRVSSSTFRSDR
jgi:hypothetical protein